MPPAPHPRSRSQPGTRESWASSCGRPNKLEILLIEKLRAAANLIAPMQPNIEFQSARSAQEQAGRQSAIDQLARGRATGAENRPRVDAIDWPIARQVWADHEAAAVIANLRDKAAVVAKPSSDAGELQAAGEPYGP
jgi:DNA-binding transcriptional regulator YdaS (Cro superfamily)